MEVEIIVEELDRLYQLDIDKYLSECETWKRYGYKIYRNSNGKHKVVKQNTTYDPSDIFDAFGGIFGNIFSGKD